MKIIFRGLAASLVVSLAAAVPAPAQAPSSRSEQPKAFCGAWSCLPASVTMCEDDRKPGLYYEDCLDGFRYCSYSDRGYCAPQNKVSSAASRAKAARDAEAAAREAERKRRAELARAEERRAAIERAAKLKELKKQFQAADEHSAELARKAEQARRLARMTPQERAVYERCKQIAQSKEPGGAKCA